MKTVDLNADLGEGMPWDFALLRRITSANVSCGAHAGDPSAIAATVAEAHRLGVVVGAHPSWPDRAGFGRVEQTATADEVEAMVIEQVGWLVALGGPVQYIKPHGALYNQAMRDDEASAPIREGLLAAVRRLGLPLMGQPGTSLERMAESRTLVYVAEGFPDRSYRSNGRLVPRTEVGAMIEGLEAVASQAIRLVERGMASLCLHGDEPEAPARADAIRESIGRAGILVRPFARS